jgi:hypothetical protein
MAIVFSPVIQWDTTYIDEGARLTGFTVWRGRKAALTVSGLSGEGGRYVHVDTGTASLTLDNYDKRYDPWNTTGALYGHILPHRPFQLYATYNWVRYYLISGWIRNPQMTDNNYASLDGTDGIDWLQASRCGVGTLQTNYAVTSAFEDLLTGVSWPFIDTSGWVLGTSALGTNTALGSALLEDNGDRIPYWYSDPDKTIWGEIEDISDAFAGDPYISATGVFSYNARALGETSALTITQDLVHKNILRPQPWEEVKNDIQIKVNPLIATTALSELWRLSYEPAIPEGETLTLWANLNFEGTPCAQTAITAPASGTDYTGGSTSGGTNKNANITIVMTAYASTVKLVISHNYAGTLYLSLLKLRGTGIYSKDTTVMRDEDTASQTAYGKQTLYIDSPWMQSTTDGKSHAGWAKVVYDQPRKIVWLRIEQRPDIQLAVDLFQQVTLDIDALQISGGYYVTSIEHEWQAGGDLITTWRCEPNGVETGGIWILGSSALDTTTILGW